MLNFKVVVYSALMVACTLGYPVYEEHKQLEPYEPAHYQFKYGVRDGHTHDNKEQSETRNGDKVEGYYKLVEPDGTTRTVHYTADKHTGFHAQVVKSGHATHPIVEKKVEIPVKKVIIPVKYEQPLYQSSIGSSFGSSLGSSLGSSYGSSLGSSLGSSFGSSSGSLYGSSLGSSLGSSNSEASSYSSFSA